jgi:hypothetical protein
MVATGNPAHRHQTRTTAHSARSHHRMVTVASCPPGRSAARSPQKEIATVMLVNELACGNFGSIAMVADPARPSDAVPLSGRLEVGRLWPHMVRPDQSRAWRSRGQRSGRPSDCARSRWIASNPLFGWHSRHWSWFLEILGRGRKLDQLSRGAWCRSPGFLPARRRSL